MKGLLALLLLPTVCFAKDPAVQARQNFFTTTIAQILEQRPCSSPTTLVGKGKTVVEFLPLESVYQIQHVTIPTCAESVFYRAGEQMRQLGFTAIQIKTYKSATYPTGVIVFPFPGTDSSNRNSKKENWSSKYWPLGCLESGTKPPFGAGFLVCADFDTSSLWHNIPNQTIV